MSVIGPLSFFCTRCEARPGQKCFSAKGKVVVKYHASRTNKAREYKRIHEGKK